jgi:predicted metal-dependent peptidase
MTNQVEVSVEELVDEIFADSNVEIDESIEDALEVVFDYTDTEVKEMIIQSRVRLLLRHPFFGTLATRLKMVEAEWCPTAAVDGYHLYYNCDFFRTLTPEEIDFVIGHEVLHVVYAHCGDGGRLFDYPEDERDGKLWNMAADYKVNQGCVESKIGSMPVSALHDRKYYNMYTEEIYDQLKENGAAPQDTLDEHMFGEGDGEGDGEDQGQGNDPTGRKAPIKLSKGQASALKDEIKQAVLNAAQAAAGNVPGNVKRMIDAMTAPKMDWRELLNLSIQSTQKSDYTWMRQSRKSRSMGLYLPAQDNDFKIELAIAIDTSGSISNQMVADFMSEVQGIMSQFPDYNLKVWTFDHNAYAESFKEFTPMNEYEIEEFNPIGGGGTDFAVNWEFMKEHDLVPDKFVMFTDGYPFGSWGDEQYCDTLFLIHGNSSIVPPFGEVAYYEFDK